MNKRKDKRFNAQLYVKLHSGALTAWGLLDDVSERGLFVKSIRGFPIGETINLDIFMPDNSISSLKAVVRRNVELPEQYRKFGVGVEVLEQDMTYRDFLKKLHEQATKPMQTQSHIFEKEAVH
jgi:hypothetical protein